MNEAKGSTETLIDELEAKSESLGTIPHFFWCLNPETKKFAHFAYMADGDACEIVEILVKRYGAEIVDRVLDRLIDEGERIEFPDIIESE